MLKNQIHRSFVLQHDSSDCGVACLLSVIRYFGGDSTIEHLRNISGTTITGTTLLSLYQAANQLGIKAKGAQANSNLELIKQKPPVILAVINEQKYEHFIVYYKYTKGKFIIGDPQFGIKSINNEHLSKIWTMKCLLLEKTNDFITRSDINNRKKQWIKQLINEDIGILTTSLFIGILLSILGMIMAVFSEKLIDEVLPQKDITKLIVGLALVFVILQGRVLLGALRNNLLIKQNQNFNNRIINFFYGKILNLPKAFFDMRKTGDIVARLDDTRKIQTVISILAGDTIINILMIIISLCFLTFYSWHISIIAFISVPIFLVIIAVNNPTIIKCQRAVMNSYAFTESNFISTIKGIAAIKNFNQQSNFKKINQIIYSIYQNKIYSLGKTQIRLGVLSGFTSIIIMIGLIAYASFLVIENMLSIGETMAVLSIVGQLLPSVASLALISIPIGEAKVAFNRIFEIVNENSKALSLSNEINQPLKIQHIDIINLSFRFTGKKTLLSNVNATFKRGEITSIVGESGSGKSTLCQILQKFYIPEKGDIFAENTNIQQWSNEHWTKQISVVPQDIYVFNGTIQENICFGLTFNNKKVIDICKKFGLLKFINDLPNGLQTMVGEDGINLSGGQKQIIALARALFKPAQILLLDEPTSGMDRITETEICNLLIRIKSQYIIILVTHRLETARKIADKICIIEEGTIKNSGTHDYLLTTDNFYSQYWKQPDIKEL